VHSISEFSLYASKAWSGGRESEGTRARPTTMFFAARVVICVLVALVGTSAAQNSTTDATPAATPAAKDYLCTKCLGRTIRASPLPPNPKPACLVLLVRVRAREHSERGAETLTACGPVYMQKQTAMENHAVGDGALVGASCDKKETAVPAW
jgi:hypothetical protein